MWAMLAGNRSRRGGLVAAARKVQQSSRATATTVWHSRASAPGKQHDSSKFAATLPHHKATCTHPPQPAHQAQHGWVRLQRGSSLRTAHQQQRAVGDVGCHMAACRLNRCHQLCSAVGAQLRRVREQQLLCAAQRAPRLAARVVLPWCLLLQLLLQEAPTGVLPAGQNTKRGSECWHSTLRRLAAAPGHGRLSSGPAGSIGTLR